MFSLSCSGDGRSEEDGIAIRWWWGPLMKREGVVVTVAGEYGVGGREDTHAVEKKKRECVFLTKLPLF